MKFIRQFIRKFNKLKSAVIAFFNRRAYTRRAEFLSGESEFIRKGYDAYCNTKLESNLWNQQGKLLREVFPSLEESFKSTDLKERNLGALIASAMKNQVVILEHKLITLGESTVLNSLGSIASTNSLEIVRDVIQNQIANLIADVKVLDGPVGNFLATRQKIEPSQMYCNDREYSSDLVNIPIDRTNIDESGAITLKLAIGPAMPGSIKIKDRDGVVVADDDGNGKIRGDDMHGTVDYAKGGIISIVQSADVIEAIGVMEYRWNIQQVPNLEFDVSLASIRTREHKITIHRDVGGEYFTEDDPNVPGVRQRTKELTAEKLRITRDRVLIKKIIDAAEPADELNFNPNPVSDGAKTPNTNKSTQIKQHWRDFDIKIKHADSYLLQKNDRGRVDYIICGINVAKIISSITDKFIEDNNPPISAYKYGTYKGNRNIDVIVDAYIDPNEYVFGFKGMEDNTSDVGVVLAEWVPIYVSSICEGNNMFIDANNINFSSYFEVLINNPWYFVKGKLLNYEDPRIFS